MQNNAQMAQQTPTTYELTPEARADVFLTRVFGKEDANTPPAPDALGNLEIGHMIARGLLHECKPEDLDASAASNPVFAAKDEAGKPVRVFLATDYDARDETPHAALLKTSDGNSYILINGPYHRWTEAYAQVAIERESGRMQKAIDSGELRPFSDLAETGRNSIGHNYDALLKFIDKMAPSLRDGAPEVHFDATGSFSGEMASAFTDGNHKNHIFLNEQEAKRRLALPEGLADTEAVIRHEFEHMANGDLTVAGLVRTHNSSPARRQAEIVADLGSGFADPVALEKHFETVLMKLVPAYNEKHAGAERIVEIPERPLVDADLKKLSDWRFGENKDFTHPGLWDRIVALRTEEEVLKKLPGSAADAPNLDAAIAAKANVIRDVMRRMQNNGVITVAEVAVPSAPAAGPALPPDMEKNFR